MTMPFGYIYALQSPSGKIYIGQTIKEVEQRLDRHFADANRGAQYPISKAVRKYGKENITVLWSFPVYGTQKELDEAEKTSIKIHNTMVPNGYNAAEGGKGGSPHKGRSHTEESKAKISKNSARKGKPGTWTGKHHSEETKAKISAVRKGRPRLEETKSKISAARKGHSTSDETKAKISSALKGRVLSEEHKATQSRVKKGRPWTEARRLAQANRKKGD